MYLKFRDQVSATCTYTLLRTLSVARQCPRPFELNSFGPSFHVTSIGATESGKTSRISFRRFGSVVAVVGGGFALEKWAISIPNWCILGPMFEWSISNCIIPHQFEDLYLRRGILDVIISYVRDFMEPYSSHFCNIGLNQNYPNSLENGECLITKNKTENCIKISNCGEKSQKYEQHSKKPDKKQT